MTSGKTGRIEFLRTKHTDHLRMNDSLYRDDELSKYTDVLELKGIAVFFYAVADEGIDPDGCETVYVYYGVFYDMDSTLDIDMTSMRFHTLISIYHDAFINDELETVIDALMAEDTEYQMRRGDISN